MLSTLGAKEQVLTSNLVVGETWTFLRRRGSHRVAVAFVDRIDALVQAGKLVVHRVDPLEEDRAWQWLRQHVEREYSFVDASSFEIMRNRRMREALAFDHDFAAAGFVEVRC
jgi:predicted nucleic acid-binding protein